MVKKNVEVHTHIRRENDVMLKNKWYKTGQKVMRNGQNRSEVEKEKARRARLRTVLGRRTSEEVEKENR